MKTLCQNCQAINPAQAPKCHNCGERIAKGPLYAAAGSDFLREQVRLLQKAGWIAHAKEFETAITALRVIHTWATFDGGRCLNPQDVAKLTRKAIKGFISSSPNR
jgi:hypothetical protein